MMMSSEPVQEGNVVAGDDHTIMISDGDLTNALDETEEDSKGLHATDFNEKPSGASDAMSSGEQQKLSDKIHEDGPKLNGTAQTLSSTATILGNTSDRNDFLPREQSSPSQNPSNKTQNEGGLINAVKQWVSSSTNANANAIDESTGDNYHRDVVDNIESALKSRKNTSTIEAKQSEKKMILGDKGLDESLLNDELPQDLEMGRKRSSTYDESAVRCSINANDKLPESNEGGDGKSKFKYTNGNWNNRMRSKTDDELRVMGECSFFYGDMGSEDNPSPSRKISQDRDEETENGYFDHGHLGKYHRTRVVNPRAIAQALSSSARRQWTERRYRCRLKQSTSKPPQSWDRQRHQIESPKCDQQLELPTYELTTEHRQAFQAAHAALNEQVANEYSRNKHAINLVEYGYDFDIDLDLNLTIDDNQQEEIRSDLTKSSLAIRGGQIRLPVDNVRLVMDSHLQPGILSVESREGGYMGYENYGNGNRYGNISANEAVPQSPGEKDSMKIKEKKYRKVAADPLSDKIWRRNELSYVLTVDDSLYRRLFQEMNDSHRLPLGMYYCCHVVESEASHDHVGIGVAISILMVVFVFLVVGMLIWPID